MNIKRVSPKDIPEIHKNLLNILEITNEDDSKYFNAEEFKKLVQNCYNEMKQKEKEKEEKLKEENRD